MLTVTQEKLATVGRGAVMRPVCRVRGVTRGLQARQNRKLPKMFVIANLPHFDNLQNYDQIDENLSSVNIQYV